MVVTLGPVLLKELGIKGVNSSGALIFHIWIFPEYYTSMVTYSRGKGCSKNKHVQDIGTGFTPDGLTDESELIFHILTV